MIEVCSLCRSKNIDKQDPYPGSPTAYYRICLDCGHNKTTISYDTVDVKVTFKIPKFLYPNIEKLLTTTNPTLDQDTAMLRYLLFKQLERVLSKLPITCNRTKCAGGGQCMQGLSCPCRCHA